MPARIRAPLTSGMPLDAFSSTYVADLVPKEGKATCSFETLCMNLPQSFPVIGEIRTEWPTEGRSQLPPVICIRGHMYKYQLSQPLYFAGLIFGLDFTVVKAVV